MGKKCINLIEYVKDFNIPITSVTYLDPEEETHMVITSEAYILSFEEETGNLNVSFHIAMSPDVSAHIAVRLVNLKSVKRINFVPLFMIDSVKGVVVTGNEARDLFNKSRDAIVLDEYKRQMYYSKLLLSDAGFDC